MKSTTYNRAFLKQRVPIRNTAANAVRFQVGDKVQKSDGAERPRNFRFALELERCTIQLH